MPKTDSDGVPTTEGGKRLLAGGQGTAEHCSREVLETVPLVMRLIRREMRAHGAQSLTTPQFRALLYLHRHPSGCLSDLAEHLGVTNPTASSIVERLVRRELTNRAPDPNERRRVLLTVTPRGEEHLETARTATRNRLAGILATLAPVERQQITAGLALLREAVEGVGSHAQ